MKTPIGKPPCGNCKACCRDTAVVLHPGDGDDVASYETEIRLNPANGEHVTILKMRPDNTCIYLGEGGCTIHERAPVACRSYDCRHFRWLVLQYTTRRDRKKMAADGQIDAEVLKAANDRRDTLEATDNELWMAKVYYGEGILQRLVNR